MKYRNTARSTMPSRRLMLFPDSDMAGRSMQSTSNIMAATIAQTISLFTVTRVTFMGATMAVTPTMSSTLKILLPTPLPTAISGVPLSADIRLTKNSGADVPAATMVSPMTISGMFILLASAEAPAVSLSAP